MVKAGDPRRDGLFPAAGETASRRKAKEILSQSTHTHTYIYIYIWGGGEVSVVPNAGRMFYIILYLHSEAFTA